MSFATKILRAPTVSLRFVPVWKRNLLVWRKLAIASVLGNIADPLLYMLALGYGLGSFIGDVGGMPYIAFIGTGMVCQSAMFTASFEGMYSAFSRMHVQRTWEGIINAPIALDDVMLAEWIWTASKAVLSTTVVVPSIAASVNNAAAITTAESMRLPGAKKTPRLREDRAARVGGKR